MRKEKLLENIRIYSHSKALFGAIFLIFVVGVFMYVILGSNLFLVSVDGNDRAVITVRKDMQGVIDICGVELGEDDVVEFTEPSETAGTLTVRRAFYVSVTADNFTETISVIDGTVRDALETCEITLGEFDEVTPSRDTLLAGNMNIKVTRVTYETREVEESIPYSTKEYYSIEYLKKTRTVTRPGEKGVRTTTYRDKYVDGERVDSAIVSVKTTKKPVDELVAVGTSTQQLLSKHRQLAQLQAGEKTPPTEYQKVMVMQGTAYTYSSIEKYNVTALGMPVREGAVAVDPKVIPYGTILYVESVDGRFNYGYCIAEDTGGGIKGNRIDLFYESNATVGRFGRRDVRVYIVG